MIRRARCRRQRSERGFEPLRSGKLRISLNIAPAAVEANLVKKDLVPCIMNSRLRNVCASVCRLQGQVEVISRLIRVIIFFLTLDLMNLVAESCSVDSVSDVIPPTTRRRGGRVVVLLPYSVQILKAVLSSPALLVD